MELKYAIQCLDAQEHKLSFRQKEAWDTVKSFVEKANHKEVVMAEIQEAVNTLTRYNARCYDSKLQNVIYRLSVLLLSLGSENPLLDPIINDTIDMWANSFAASMKAAGIKDKQESDSSGKDE